jgi:hypothetical protein
MSTGIATKESPFTPGRPVPVEYFVARHKEIERIERAIGQTTFGRNENVFITGERGIGKSSLAGFVRCLAEKEYGLIGSHCPLGGVSTLEDMMGVIFQRLLQDCTDKSLFDKLKDFFSEYIKGLTLFGVGVEFTEDRSKLKTLVNNFLPVMRKIYDEVKSTGKKGLILILDDLNGITDVPVFSRFLKSFVDELALSGKPLPILLVLVGLPERREELIKHQPSVARIFDIVDLSLMTKDESGQFFTDTFDRQSITVSQDSLSLMVELSGGYPMLMHEVGNAVFWQDTDNNIDLRDAKQGIMEAARTIGKQYIDPKISKVLRSKTYSSILWRIGKKLPLGGAFKRQELLKEIPSKEQRNLDNFLNRIKKLGIIDDAEVRGEYRFVNPLYHLYVWYLAKSKAEK